MRSLCFKAAAILVLVTVLGSCAFGAASVDIDGSGEVNFEDFAIMGDYWHHSGPVADIGGADGNSDGIVDMLDIAVLCESWLDDTSETIGTLAAEAMEFSRQQIWATHVGASSYTAYPSTTDVD